MKLKLISGSIKFKIGMLVGITATVVMSVLASVSYVSTLNSLENQHTAGISSKSSEIAVLTQSHYKQGFDFNNYLSAQIKAAFDPIYPMALSIDEIFPVVRNYMRTNENIIGVNLVLEEGIISYSDTTNQIRDYFDSFGRFAVHFWRDPSGKIRFEKLLNLDSEPKGDFYLQPRKFQRDIITSPEFLNFHGVEQLLFWQATPIMLNNEFKGVVAVVVNNAPLKDFFTYSNESIHTHWQLTNSRGIIIYDSNQPFFVGQNINQVYTESVELLVDIQSNKIARHDLNDKLIIGQPVALTNLRSSFYVLSSTLKSEIADEAMSFRIKMITISFLMLLSGGLIIVFFLNYLIKPLSKVADIAEEISLGKIQMEKLPERNDEIGKVSSSLNQILDSLNKMAEFANQIGKGKLDAEYETFSKDDSLGNALLAMRQSLIDAENLEDKRRDEDHRRNWTTEGLAKFGNILRQNNDNIEEFAYNVISELTQYVGAVQGALFIVTDIEGDKKQLELVSAFAYSKRKYLKRVIDFGNELVGTCAIEKNTIIVNQVPDSYVYITSGLGETKPKQIVLVPLIYKDKLYGVIEIAMLHKLEPFRIAFVETLAENIASTVSSVKIADQTNKLLVKTKQQSEDMLLQEDEMRINMEELQATQERFAQQDSEIKSLLNAVDKISLMAEFDLEGVLIFANDLFAEFFDKSKDAMLGKTAVGIFQIPFNTIDEFNVMWSRLRDGEIIESGWEIQVGDKEKRYKAILAPILNTDGLPFKIVAIGYEAKSVA